jgi:hypothetical protein
MDLRPLSFANLPLAAGIGLLASRAGWLFPMLAVVVEAKPTFLAAKGWIDKLIFVLATDEIFAAF